MRRIALATLFALSACATTQQGVRVETVTVKVAVPTPCIKASDLPANPAPMGALSGDASRDISIIAAAGLRWRAVALERAAMLGACAMP